MTSNKEVIKNIEDIANSIMNKNKIKFEYWKYGMTNKIEKVIKGETTRTKLIKELKIDRVTLKKMYQEG